MYRLYVGSDNKSHLLTETQIAAVVDTTSDYFDSFTYTRATGMFRRQAEDTLIIAIATEDNEKIHQLIAALCNLLKQESVGIEYGSRYEIITREK